jgi:flagellar hook-associated protein 1 FlgK
MGVNSILNIASSGVSMSQLAMEVTSENIANVNTPGYSTQRAVFETAQVLNTNGFPLGSGVQLAAVQRNHDDLLQLQIAKGNSAYGESSTKQTALEQIEPSFNELNSDGLGQAMNNFFNSWQDLSVTPAGTTERQSVLSSAQTLVDTFHQMSSTLQDAASNADTSLTGITTDITDKAKSIASLNSQIVQTERLGGNANELRDQRDYLVQEMSKEMSVTYTEQSDGTMTIKLPANTGGGGQTLVDGSNYATLYTNTNAGTGKNDILLTAVGNPPPSTSPGTDTNVTATIGGPNDPSKAPDNSLGEIGGALQVRDSIVPGYLGKLDEMANELVTTVNAKHSSGYGLDGSQNNFFDPANTTSADISINTAIVSDPQKIAAASQDPTSATGGTGDNSNALAIAGIRSNPITFNVTVNGATTTTNSTFSSFYTSFVSSVGVDTRNATNTTTQNNSYLQQLTTLQASNSGVSLDEELTNLIKYQQAYQASAKMINTASTMMDTILNLVT